MVDTNHRLAVLKHTLGDTFAEGSTFDAVELYALHLRVSLRACLEAIEKLEEQGGDNNSNLEN